MQQVGWYLSQVYAGNCICISTKSLSKLKGNMQMKNWPQIIVDSLRYLSYVVYSVR